MDLNSYQNKSYGFYTGDYSCSLRQFSLKKAFTIYKGFQTGNITFPRLFSGINLEQLLLNGRYATFRHHLAKKDG